MALSAFEGNFALECWQDAESEGNGHCVYSNDRDELLAEADRLLAAGHYSYITLTKYNPETDDWDVLDENVGE